MQLSLDPQQEMCELKITVRRGREGKRCAVFVTVSNDYGSVLMHTSLRGTKARDESGLADVLKEVGRSFLYGSPADVDLATKLAWHRHMPMLPSHLG